MPLHGHDSSTAWQTIAEKVVQFESFVSVEASGRTQEIESEVAVVVGAN